MRVLEQPRKSGKTRRYVSILQADPRAVLIVMHYEEKQRLVTQYDLKASEANRIRLLNQPRPMPGNATIYIDELAHVLANFVGAPIEEATL